MRLYETNVLRWHIARFHAWEAEDRERVQDAPEDFRAGVVEAMIAGATVRAPAELSDPQRPLDGITDRLDWWQLADGDPLHGWTTAGSLLAALEASLERIDAGPYAVAPIPRRITEDMVLLQVLPPGGGGLDPWRASDEDAPFPDLRELVAQPESFWRDYTQPARRMSKEIYRAALGGRRGGDGEVAHAAQ